MNRQIFTFLFLLMVLAQAFAQPSNDLCRNAIRINVGSSVVGSITNATLSSGYNSVGRCDQAAGGGDVWYYANVTPGDVLFLETISLTLSGPDLSVQMRGNSCSGTQFHCIPNNSAHIGGGKATNWCPVGNFTVPAGVTKIYFCFPDINARSTGTFRFSLSLVSSGGGSGGGSSLSLSPKSATIAANKTKESFDVISSDPWTATTTGAISINKTSGGSGTNKIKVEFSSKNSTYSDRTARVKVKSGGKTKTYRITQEGKVKTYFITYLEDLVIWSLEKIRKSSGVYTLSGDIKIANRDGFSKVPKSPVSNGTHIYCDGDIEVNLNSATIKGVGKKPLMIENVDGKSFTIFGKSSNVWHYIIDDNEIKPMAPIVLNASASILGLKTKFNYAKVEPYSPTDSRAGVKFIGGVYFSDLMKTVSSNNAYTGSFNKPGRYRSGSCSDFEIAIGFNDQLFYRNGLFRVLHPDKAVGGRPGATARFVYNCNSEDIDWEVAVDWPKVSFFSKISCSGVSNNNIKELDGEITVNNGWVTGPIEWYGGGAGFKAKDYWYIQGLARANTLYTFKTENILRSEAGFKWYYGSGASFFADIFFLDVKCAEASANLRKDYFSLGVDVDLPLNTSVDAVGVIYRNRTTKAEFVGDCGFDIERWKLRGVLAQGYGKLVNPTDFNFIAGRRVMGFGYAGIKAYYDNKAKVKIVFGRSALKETAEAVEANKDRLLDYVYEPNYSLPTYAYSSRGPSVDEASASVGSHTYVINNNGIFSNQLYLKLIGRNTRPSGIVITEGDTLNILKMRSENSPRLIEEGNTTMIQFLKPAISNFLYRGSELDSTEIVANYLEPILEVSNASISGTSLNVAVNTKNVSNAILHFYLDDTDNGILDGMLVAELKDDKSNQAINLSEVNSGHYSLYVRAIEDYTDVAVYTQPLHYKNPIQQLNSFKLSETVNLDSTLLKWTRDTTHYYVLDFYTDSLLQNLIESIGVGYVGEYTLNPSIIVPGESIYCRASYTKWDDSMPLGYSEVVRLKNISTTNNATFFKHIEDQIVLPDASLDFNLADHLIDQDNDSEVLSIVSTSMSNLKINGYSLQSTKPAAGIYTVSLQVKDGSYIDNTSFRVVVLDSLNASPVLDIKEPYITNKDISIHYYIDHKIISDSSSIEALVWSTRNNIGYDVTLERAQGSIGRFKGSFKSLSKLNLVDGDSVFLSYAGLTDYSIFYENKAEFSIVGRDTVCEGELVHVINTSTAPNYTTIKWYVDGEILANTGNNMKTQFESTVGTSYDKRVVRMEISSDTKTWIATDTIYISQKPDVGLQDTTNYCSGDTLILYAPKQDKETSFVWSTNGDYQIGDTFKLNSPLRQNLVTVFSKDEHGCESEDSMITIRRKLPDARLSVIGNSTQCSINNSFDVRNDSRRGEADIKETKFSLLNSNKTVALPYSFSEAQGDNGFVITVIDNFDCPSLDTAFVTILPSPTAAFGISDSILCTTGNRLAKFTNESDGQNLRFDWRLTSGIGTKRKSEDVTYEYQAKKAVYRPFLKVTNSSYCSDTVSMPIYLVRPPQHTHIDMPSTLCEGQTIELKATHTISDFNMPFTTKFVVDGISYDSSVVSYILTDHDTIKSLGVYVENAPGCKDSIVLRDVFIGEKPTASILALESEICEGDTFVLSSTNSRFTRDSIVFIEWTDGSSGETRNLFKPVHGEYTQQLMVSTNWCSDSTTIENLIVNPGVENRFSIVRTDSCENSQNIMVIDESVSDDLSFQSWRIGERSVVNNLKVSFDTTPGIHTVFGFSETIAGCTDSSSIIFNVYKKPDLVNAWVDSVCQNTLTPLNLNKDFDIVNMNWGDGISNMQSSHTYKNYGNYIASLKASDSRGCKNEVELNVVVIENPVSDFEYLISDSIIGFIETLIRVKDNSIGAITWQYAISDGSFYNDPDFPHIFQDSGNYTLTQTSYNWFGCNDIVSQEVYVQSKWLHHIPTAFSPNDDGLNDFWKPSTSYAQEWTLRIYNSYGELVWQTNDPNESWDGMYRGQPAQQGVYSYTFRALPFRKNAGFKYSSGTVTVLR
jgi:gliding motility-associated-like protein